MLRILIGAAVVVVQMHSASPAADLAHGRQLAERWCSGCHAVIANPPRATDTPAPFKVIAQKWDFDAGRLAYFLLNPHPIMPNMALSRSEAADLAAYIASLR